MKPIDGSLSALADRLGRRSEDVLREAPFSTWRFLRSVEEDLPESAFYYEAAEAGIEWIADASDRLSTIFLTADGIAIAELGLHDLGRGASRQSVTTRFGRASSSGSAAFIPELGAYGGWDRFERQNYVVHFEYQVGSDAPKRITLMRLDVVPPKPA